MQFEYFKYSIEYKKAQKYFYIYLHYKVNIEYMQASDQQTLAAELEQLLHKFSKLASSLTVLLQDIQSLQTCIEQGRKLRLPTNYWEENSPIKHVYKGRKAKIEEQDLIAYLLTQKSVLETVDEIRKDVCAQLAEAGDYNEIQVSQETLYLTLFIDYLKGIVEDKNLL